MDGPVKMPNQNIKLPTRESLLSIHRVAIISGIWISIILVTKDVTNDHRASVNDTFSSCSTRDKTYPNRYGLTIFVIINRISS